MLNNLNFTWDELQMTLMLPDVLDFRNSPSSSGFVFVSLQQLHVISIHFQQFPEPFIVLIFNLCVGNCFFFFFIQKQLFPKKVKTNSWPF